MGFALPNRQQLEAIAAMRHGDLAEVSYPVLLHALSEHHATGALEIQRRPVKKRIVLIDGSPSDCRSNLVHETFGPFLVSVGRLKEDQLHHYTSKAMVKGVPIGEVLLEAKILGPSELYKLLQQNLARKLLDGFSWTSGEFTFTPGDVDGADTTLKVRVPQLVLTGLLKFGDLENAQAALAVWGDQALALDPAHSARLVELKLPGRYSQLIEALSKPRAMHELLLATSLSPTEVVRIVHALGLLGCIAPASTVVLPKTAEISPRQVSTPAAATPPLPTPVAAAGFDREAVKNGILEEYLSYRRKDAFELLGLEENASNLDIDKAFWAFARRLRTFELEDLGEADHADKARLLLLAGAEAIGELKDVEKRNALILRRRTLRDERAKKSFSEGHIKTDLLDSAVQYKKGLAALEAGAYDKALGLLRFASDCDPQNALYLAEAAYCAFLKDSVLNLARSTRELEQAVRLDENCGQAHYYLGEAYAEAGRFDDAERHLRKAVKILAPDRRPIEALKHLAARRAKR
jgi:hypothetical protein